MFPQHRDFLQNKLFHHAESLMRNRIELNSEFESLSKQISSCRSRINGLRGSISESNGKVLRRMNELTRDMASINGIEFEIISIRTILSSLDSRRSKIVEILDRENRILDEIHVYHQSLVCDIVRLDSIHRSLPVNEVIEKIEEIKRKVKEKKLEIESLKQSREELNENLCSINNEYYKCREEEKHISSSLSSLESKKSEIECDLTLLFGEIDNNLENISFLEGKVDELQNKLEEDTTPSQTEKLTSTFRESLTIISGRIESSVSRVNESHTKMSEEAKAVVRSIQKKRESIGHDRKKLMENEKSRQFLIQRLNLLLRIKESKLKSQELERRKEKLQKITSLRTQQQYHSRNFCTLIDNATRIGERLKETTTELSNSRERRYLHGLEQEAQLEDLEKKLGSAYEEIKNEFESEKVIELESTLLNYGGVFDEISEEEEEEKKNDPSEKEIVPPPFFHIPVIPSENTTKSDVHDQEEEVDSKSNTSIEDNLDDIEIFGDESSSTTSVTDNDTEEEDVLGTVNNKRNIRPFKEEVSKLKRRKMMSSPSGERSQRNPVLDEGDVDDLDVFEDKFTDLVDEDQPYISPEVDQKKKWKGMNNNDKENENDAFGDVFSFE